MNESAIKQEISIKDNFYRVIFGIGILTALYIVSRNNYLVFHTLAEFFSIAVAWSLFLIFWNTKKNIENKSLILLGIAYLFIGSLDLMHTLSYKGMGVLGPETGANPATQLWIFARYIESITLCLFSSRAIKNVDETKTILVYSSILCIGLLTIFYWEIFPVCYIDGVGLTRFKIFSECLICGILILSLILLSQNRSYFDDTVYRSMMIAIILTVFAELSFTFYVSVYGLSNLFGHYFKIVSFYFVYRALIQSGLRKPHTLLYDRIKKSESRFQKFFENSGIYAYQIASDGTILDVNTTVLSKLGYTRDDLIGKPLSNIYADESLEKAKNHFQEWKSTGQLNNVELSIKTKNGDIRWVLLNADAVKDDQDNILHSTSIQVDITDQKEIMNDLQKLSNDQSAILDNVQAYIYFKDKENNIIKISQSVADATGLPKEKIEGRHSSEIYPDTADMYWADDLEVIRSGKPKLGIVEPLPVESGETRWLLTDKIPYFDTDGQVSGIIVFCTDITERKKAEDEKLHLEKELSQSQKMESIGTLAGGIAHEFNNILSIIIGNNELIMEDLPEWNLSRENCEEIRLAGLRARDIVKHLLTFSRQDDSTKKPVDIHSVVSESLKLIRATTPAYIEIKEKLSSDCPPILGNATQLNQVLINLFNNAIDAIPVSNGTIEIELCIAEIERPTETLAPGKYLKLIISDNGSGMDKQVVDRIFEPYFTTKDIGKGSGIGLAVVHGIIEDHDGNIVCKSAKNKGTEFIIHLPAFDGKVQREPEETDVLPGNGECILYIDDEPSIAKLGKRHLESLGYNAYSTTDPLEALKLVGENSDKFDLIISDMAMPKLPGDELIKKILKSNPKLPTIICTGYSSKLSEKEASEIGVKAFLMKPLNKSELADKIRKVLDDSNQIKS